MSREEDNLQALRDRAIQATRPGRCQICQDRIDEDEWIVRYEDHWVHLECAEGELA